jgi:predicted MFS family arabinose efflux permease
LGVRSPKFLAAFIFIACFRFRPEPPILYYQRDVLSFEANFLGVLGAIISISVGLGAIVFGTFAYKISRRNLLNLTIAFRSISTLALVFIQDEKSAILIWLFCGFTDVMATLGALEVAATACPDESEGTAYALLMSLWNFANTPGVILGGWLWDRGMQFSVIVSLSALSTALCWFLIPLLKLDRK